MRKEDNAGGRVVLMDGRGECIAGGAGEGEHSREVMGASCTGRDDRSDGMGTSRGRDDRSAGMGTGTGRDDRSAGMGTGTGRDDRSAGMGTGTGRHDQPDAGMDGQEVCRPKVLVIAGYDQSAGAGVLSDVKTLEAHSVYGYAVCTGFTFQNEKTIRRLEWFSDEEVFEQIDLCFESTGFDWVKMGITRSMQQALNIFHHLRQHNPAIRMVMDPVIRASSGAAFWTLGNGREDWEEILASCYLLTPNWEEMGWLYPGDDIQKRCALLTQSGKTNIYLKGGHHPHRPGQDFLWSQGEVRVLKPEPGLQEVYPKHGSGCVMASALTANLALGYSLYEAACRSKKYIHRFLTSNTTTLGWHH